MIEVSEETASNPPPDPRKVRLVDAPAAHRFDVFEDAVQPAGADYFLAMVEKADEWLGFEAIDDLTFDVALHLGTALALIVYFHSDRIPQTFCSQVVEKNHGFRIGLELQQNGLEMWRVACVEREHAEQLLEDLEALGQIKAKSITEQSWQMLLNGGKS